MKTSKGNSFEEGLVDNGQEELRNQQFNPYENRRNSFPDMEDRPIPCNNPEPNAYSDFEAFDMDDPMKSSLFVTLINPR